MSRRAGRVRPLDPTIASQLMNKNIVVKEMSRQLNAFTKDLHKDIVAATPVDTGSLKADIKRTGVKKINALTRRIGTTDKRSEEYANIIMIDGRHQRGNKMYGSLQLPDGILPLVRAKIAEGPAKKAVITYND